MGNSFEIEKFSHDEYIVTLPKTLCPVCQTNELPVTQNICDSCLEKTMYKTKEHKTKTIKPKPKLGQRKVKFN
jgi:predicted amidophosphoribosyltransferase